MVNVNDLLVGEATLKMPWQGKDVSITYNPNAYTPEIEAGWAQMEKESSFSGPMITDFVCRLVTKWDVKGDWVPEDPAKPDGDGKFVETDEMFPVAYEKVAKLPMTFLGKIVEMITEDSVDSGRQ